MKSVLTLSQLIIWNWSVEQHTKWNLLKFGFANYVMIDSL